MLEELERLLADLRAAGVRTTLFINPFHVDYLAVIRDAGLGPEMAAWKRALTRIAMADDAVTLWDFTTFSSLASERPAAKRGAPPAEVVLGTGPLPRDARRIDACAHVRPRLPAAIAGATGLTGRARLRNAVNSQGS